jgi:hypothetical protein
MHSASTLQAALSANERLLFPHTWPVIATMDPLMQKPDLQTLSKLHG